MYICKILFTLHLIYDIMLIINIYGGLSMQYKIEGGSLPIVEVSLENGETIITQGGRVFLQSHPISTVASAIRPFITTN